MADATVRIAAGLLAFLGLGFGLCGAYGVWSLATGRGVPLVLGFPSYGGGPFERMGIPSTVPLVAGFVVVCAAQVVAAWLLWRGEALGGWIAVGSMVPALAYYYGFALPFGPLLGIPAVALVLLRWKTLG